MNRHGVRVHLTVSDATIAVDAGTGAPEARVAGRLPLGLALGMIAVVSVVSNAKAQEAEPRSYSNTPIGLNFLIAGYAYSQGKLAFDPNTAIADAAFRSDTGVLAYVRSFELVGQSAKLDVIVPTSSFAAHGLVNGEPREREILGLGDPRFRVSVNLFGAPALSAKEFASYRQDVIVGVCRSPRRSGSMTTRSCST